MSNETKKIRLLIVDDHELVRIGLRTAFEEHSDIEVVGEANATDSAVSETARLQPDVVLMDLRLPGGGGVQACREILAEYPQVHVLFLTSLLFRSRLHSCRRLRRSPRLLVERNWLGRLGTGN